MIPDGVEPDLHGYSLFAGKPTGPLDADHDLVGPAPRARAATGVSGERLWQVRVALRRAQDELLQAHVATIVAMRQVGRDHARLTDALAQARSHHEALFLVRKAVDALATPARRAGE